MSRAGEGGRLKKRNCCLTCSIVCFIILLIFIATLFIGGTILFNTYVSPYIGGLSLSDALALSANVMSGKEAEVTYDEKTDLDEFYFGLSHALFLSDKTDVDLQYDLVPESKRQELAALAAQAAAEGETAAAGEDDSSESEESTYDNDAAFDYFKNTLTTAEERYAYAVTDLTLQEFSSLATNEAAREKAGLKLYRLDLTSVMDKALSSGGSDLSSSLENELASMAFSFDALKDYEIVYDTDSDAVKAEKNAANEKLKVFEVAEKPAAAFINDVVSSVLKSEKITSTLNEKLSADLDLAKYVTVASVSIARNPLLSTAQEAVYGKDTVLSITLSANLRTLVKDALETDALKEKLSSVPSFAINLIPNLVPKFFSANVTVYPFAESEDNHEMVVLLNNPSEKNGQRLSTLLNALLADSGSDPSRTFLAEMNDKVVSAFQEVNKVVPLEFVATKDLQGGDVSGLRLATWETVVNLIQNTSSSEEKKFDVDDVMIVLKGVFYKEGLVTDPLEADPAVSAFKGDMSGKYGVSSAFLAERNLLDSDTASDLPKNINLAGLDYSLGSGTFEEKNTAMEVNFPSYAIADYLEKILKDENSSSSSTETAAAGEEESSSSSSTDLKKLGLEICDIEIAALPDDPALAAGTKLFTMTLEASVKLSEYIKEQMGDSKYVKGLFSGDDKPTKLGIKIYIAEYLQDGKVAHTVGTEIDHPGEENVTDSRYGGVITVNKYDEADSEIFFASVKKIMSAVSENSYDLSSVIGDVETRLRDLFKSLSDNKDLKLDLKLYGADAAMASGDPESFQDVKGGITLPSIFELVANMTYSRLNPSETSAEETTAFAAEDAWKALSLIYDENYLDKESAIYTPTYDAREEEDAGDNDADRFLAEINGKYYFKDDKGLTVELLFGKNTGESTSLSDSITAENIDFDKLYTDDRTINALRVQMNGKNLAALVADKDSGLLNDVAGSFGEIKVIGAHFEEEDGETYLYFDLQVTTQKKSDSEQTEAATEEESSSTSVEYENLFPDDLKITAVVHMTSEEVDSESGKKLYPTHLVINDNDQKGAKVFLMMKAFGGSSFNEESIAKQIGDSIAGAFNDIEAAHLKVDYTVCEQSDSAENYVTMDDVFTLLVNYNGMTDRDPVDEYDEVDLTDPADLMNRLRTFGKQKAEDFENTDDTWLGLDTFSKADYDYVERNLHLAYFLNGTITIDSFYEGFSTSGTFGTIDDTTFNLSGANGLFSYEGNVVKLKISDKALGYIVQTKESEKISAAVPPTMIAELVSLTFDEEGGVYTVTCGIKITFNYTSEEDASKGKMMPDYFFVQATATIVDDAALLHYEDEGHTTHYYYPTVLGINDLGDDETGYFFHNFTALSGKGLTFDFKKEDIEKQIGESLCEAFRKMDQAEFGTFDAADFDDTAGNNTYTETNYTVTPGEGDPYVLNLPTQGDICLSFPSIYSFITEKLYEGSSVTPADVELQSMIVEMHRSDDDLEDQVVTNPKSDSDASTIGFTDNTMSDPILIYSDRNLAKKISDQFASANGDLSNDSLGKLEGIEQLIVLANGTEWSGDYAFTYTAGHAYVLTTAKIDLTGYTTGSVSLLPSDIYFTVLIDMDASPATSQALLFNMSDRDMEILTEIINHNKQDGADDFDKDDIAETIAGLIRPKINALNTYGGTIYYKDADESYTYYYYDGGVQQGDYANEVDGVGYVVLSSH